MCRSRAQPVIDENELSMAGNSRYTKERKDCYRKEDGSKIHVSGRHSWNFFKGTGLLFLVAFSLLCGSSRADSKPCIVTKDGKYDCPFSKEVDVYVEHGNTAKIVCKRSGSSIWQPPYGRRVSDLSVVLNDKVVQPLTDFGTDEVRLPLNTLPPSTNKFECRLKIPNDVKGRSEVIFRATISVGFKPKKPRSFKCVSHNLEKLVCTWDPEPNTVPTRFSLRVNPPGRSSFVCPAPQAGSKIPPNSCVWDTSTNPPYNPAEENYTFILDGANTLGKNSFAYKFHQWENVIPSQPDKLTVLNTTDSSAWLRWIVPRPMRNFPPGLHHRVSYQAQSDSRKTWRTIDVPINVDATEVFFHLTDLEFADTVYNVRVSSKSSLAVGEDKWSQPAETIFKTAVSPSSLPPRTDVGSFETVGDGDKRDVYVYWQRIPGIPDNKNTLPYKVVRVEKNGRSLNLQPNDITKTYAKFTGIGSDGINLHIAAASQTNGPTTTVHIPSQSETPQKPVVHTKIALGRGTYELSWDPSTNPNIKDYTIFWCENARDRPYQCSGHLDWVHVPRDTHTYNITVPDPKKTYQFAIAANTAKTSSGMVWFSGMTTLSNDVGKPKTVGVDRVGSDSAEVKWELPYSGRIGIVKGFNIYYCPALPSQQCTGPTTKTFVKGDQHLTGGTLRDLRPDTTYKLTVAVLSEKGEGLHSAPWYFTTTKAAPDLSSIENTIRVAIEQSSSGLKDYVKDLMKQYKQNEIDELRSQMNDSVAQVSNLGLTITALNAKLDSLSDSVKQLDKVFGQKLNGIHELDARINDSITKVSNLTPPISALNVKIDSLSKSTKQRDEALDRKLDEIGDLKSGITNAATQVSNLMLPISTLNARLDSLSDSIRQRDKALDDKLNGIEELNSRIKDSVTQLSNLTSPISALNVKIDSLSKSTKQRDEALDRKLDEIGDLKSGITNATTQVSNLVLSLSDSIKQRDEALDDKLNGIGELNSRITNAVTQVSNLTLPISALNAKLDSLSESTRQRDEALDRKLDGIDELKSKITESATQVSSLTRPIVAFDAKLDSLSDSFKQCDKALDDKLGGIDELNARINDSVTGVSNLGKTISAYKAELVSLSEENCQVRGNLTECERLLSNSLGQTDNS